MVASLSPPVPPPSESVHKHPKINRFCGNFFRTGFTSTGHRFCRAIFLCKGWPQTKTGLACPPFRTDESILRLWALVFYHHSKKHHHQPLKHLHIVPNVVQEKKVHISISKPDPATNRLMHADHIDAELIVLLCRPTLNPLHGCGLRPQPAGHKRA